MSWRGLIRVTSTRALGSLGGDLPWSRARKKITILSSPRSFDNLFRYVVHYVKVQPQEFTEAARTRIKLQGGKMKRRRFIHSYLILLCLIVPLVLSLPDKNTYLQTVSDGQQRVKLDVPYEPSSEEVVRTMLEIAQVGRDDVVYDLGCGDGRIVIAAAQRTGARGVGIDLDPERIKESLANARKAGVTDRVRFFQQDLFGADIGKATVVMLYLWPEVNLKLRPKLLHELRPGTRVISHSHNMGNWEPDQSIAAANGHRVYFWVIPANVTGVWEWGMPGEGDRYGMKLSQQFQRISGTLQLGPDEIPVKNLELRGDRLQFTTERFFKGEKQTFRFNGGVQGNLMEGTVEGMPAGFQGKQPWKAKRDPSSIKSLD
jgi:SAM-dependent methyltransferase